MGNELNITIVIISLIVIDILLDNISNNIKFPQFNPKKVEQICYISRHMFQIVRIGLEKIMKLLTRAEELILLAIWQLQEDAYCIPIRSKISELSGEEWSLGSIYMPLDRLSKRGLLDSYLSDKTPERGGRHKRIYTLTEEGKESLIKVREVQTNMWADVTGLESSK